MPAIAGWGEAGSLVYRVAIQFVLLVLPGAAVSLFAFRRKVCDPVLLVLLFLSAVGVLSYLSFWISFTSPSAGRIFAYILPIGCAVYVFRAASDLGAVGRAVFRKVCAAVLLAGTAAMFVTSLGFLYGGLDSPIDAAQTRFSHHLPVDNMLPLLFAEGVRSGKVPKPFFMDWHSSDRGPLQTGFVLQQYPFFARPRALGYTIAGILAQSLWILALWGFLISFGVRSKPATLCLTACLFSGFTLVNTFFVWPKLLAAAYTLNAISPLVYGSMRGREGVLRAVIAGSSASLALLAHGGAIFAMIALLPGLLVWRRGLDVRTLGVMATTAIVCYLPWMLYQKLYDPPGDRLIKMHLANAEKVDPRSAGTAIREAYGKLTLNDLAANKAANIAVVLTGRNYWRDLGHLSKAVLQGGWCAAAKQAARQIRSDQFFFFSATLGWFVFSPLALVTGAWTRFRSQEYRVAIFLYLCTVGALAVWCVLMFGPATTVVHQGAYATVLLAFAASVLALWAFSPWLAYVVTVLHFVVTATVFVPTLDSTASPLRAVLGVVVLGSAGAILYLLHRLNTSENREEGTVGRPVHVSGLSSAVLESEVLPSQHCEE